jgi:hypothetical protein
LAIAQRFIERTDEYVEPGGDAQEMVFFVHVTNLPHPPVHVNNYFKLFHPSLSLKLFLAIDTPLAIVLVLVNAFNHMSSNLKDGFTGDLIQGDRLFPESIDLGLGNYVTADNIEELMAIFSSEPIHFVNTI